MSGARSLAPDVWRRAKTWPLLLRITVIVPSLLATLIIGMLLVHGHSVSSVYDDWYGVWGSCLNPPLEYWKKSQWNPARLQPCSALALKAALAGTQMQLRGIQISKGLVDRPALDGCKIARGGSNGSFASDAWGPTGPQIDGTCKLEWITYTTECSTNLNRIADICDLMGITLKVVGLKTWWMGFGGRLRMLHEVLQSLPLDRLVFTSDADDVILLPSPHCEISQIFDKFSTVGKPVLFGAERYCYPDGKLWSHYPPPPRETPYLYVNGGTAMGWVWALLDVMGRAYRGDCVDDQREYTRVYLNQVAYVGRPNLEGRRTIVDRTLETRTKDPFEIVNEYIKLDWFNTLFMPLGGGKLDEFDYSTFSAKGILTSSITGGKPCFWHQNGDKEERENHPVVWNHFLNATKIDETRRKMRP